MFYIYFYTGDGSKFDMTSEIDPEVIRSSLRDFAQKLKDLERERDEATAKVVAMQRQVVNLEKDRSECEDRVQTLQKNLEDTEEGMRKRFFFFYNELILSCELV